MTLQVKTRGLQVTGFRTLWRGLLLTLGLSLLPNLASAGEIQGRFSSDLYFYEQNDISHTRPYETLSFVWTVWRDTLNRSAQLRSYSRWTTDLANKRPGDPQFFMYDGYLQLNQLVRGAKIRAGRQFAYSGVSSALIDGLRITYRKPGKWSLDVYGGASVSRLDPETVRKLSDYSAFGARALFRVDPSWRIGLGWSRHQEAGATSLHRLGIDLERDADNVNAYVKWIYNFQYSRTSAFLSRVSTTSGKWYYSGEFQLREPSTFGASLFSIIDVERYREARFEAQRKFQRNLALFADLGVTFYEDASATRFGIGVRSPGVSVAWRHQSGDKGDRNGLYGNVVRKIGESAELYANANLTRYRVQEEQVDLNDSYAGAIGITQGFSSVWKGRVEGQYIRTAVDSYDWRLLLSVTRRFVGGGGRNGGAR